jgi:type 1 glutamine amidotransferase
MTDKIRTAVVTGRHAYEVPPFINLFRSIPEIDFYPQHMEDFVADNGGFRQTYDVIVFYNFHQETPVAGEDGKNNMKDALETLGETDQGLMVLHHALLAFRQWEFWSDLVGIEERGFGYHHDETIQVEIANPDHPITQGLAPWTLLDETYTVNNASGPDNNILLTTDHPRSMNTLAWTRQFRQSRVFCYQSGHNHTAFDDTSFRTVMRQGILWLAGRI